MADNALDKLKAIAGHDNLILTNRGNTAVRLALKAVKQANPDNGKRMVLIQDQGGWISYHKFTEKLKLQKFNLKTTFGVILPYQLEKALGRYDNFAAIIYENPAGYYADQPYKEIYEICQKNDVLVILDVTGCIGLDKFGKYADILVCSFGDGSPIDLGYGGFVSFKDKELFGLCDYSLEKESKDTYDKILAGLPDKLGKLGQKYGLIFNDIIKIKADLSRMKILHKDKKGIVVVVMYQDDAEKKKIIDYCNKNKYEFIECPKYTRVNAKAISIEAKSKKL